jgi:hypothetical protein
LQLLVHLWANYGTITQQELDENQTGMQQPWYPPSPNEALFNQLEEGIMFVATWGEALSNTQVIRTGYNLISATGLFELPCREWSQKAQIDKAMPAFQDHFCQADLDHLLTATTGTAGYHGATNHVDIASLTLAPTPAPILTTEANTQIIAKTVRKQVALALAAMHVTPPTNNQTHPKLYCWSHGIMRNLQHSSK